MSVSRLTSKDNRLLKTIRLVAAGGKRAPQGLVLAEGIRVLEEVTATGHEIETALFVDNFGAAPREKALLEKWESAGVRLCQTSESIFKTVSGVQAPQGALALVKVPERNLTDATPARNPMIVFACGIQDPGNMGTLIRTAVAAGSTEIVTEKGTVGARNPKTIRASAGAFFHLVPIEDISAGEFLDYCRCSGIQPYRSAAREGIKYTDADLKASCAFLLGNEGSGMSAKELAGVPCIRIPMDDRIESLNVATAGAVILFEAARQRSA
jgi:RNA methyltransferase, TrmH family